MSSVDTFAPGNVVVVRDEDWLVRSVDESSDGPVPNAQGLSDLTRARDAVFCPTLARGIRLNGAREVTFRADDSPKYRDSRSWVATTLRKTAVPLGDDWPTVLPRMLARQLGYQQHEMWSRFAISLIRPFSQGVAHVTQKLPVNGNPFSYYRHIIISIDRLKQEPLIHDLRRHHWDAVVIDESHNVTNTDTLNKRLARTGSPPPDALIHWLPRRVGVVVSARMSSPIARVTE